MLKAFCDESSDAQSQSYLVFASFYETGELWAELEPEWQRVLDQYGLTEFHAIDCNSGRGSCRDLSGDARQSLCYSMIEILKTYRPRAVCCYLQLAKYKQLQEQFKHARKIPSGMAVSGHLGAAWFLGAQFMIERLAQDVNERQFPPGLKLEITFDENQEFNGRANAMFKSIKESDLSYVARLSQKIEFASSNGCLPLQAADLLAFEFRRHLENPSEKRRQWDELSVLVPHWREVPNESMPTILSWLNSP